MSLESFGKRYSDFDPARAAASSERGSTEQPEQTPAQPDGTDDASGVKEWNAMDNGLHSEEAATQTPQTPNAPFAKMADNIEAGHFDGDAAQVPEDFRLRQPVVPEQDTTIDHKKVPLTPSPVLGYAAHRGEQLEVNDPHDGKSADEWNEFLKEAPVETTEQTVDDLHDDGGVEHVDVEPEDPVTVDVTESLGQSVDIARSRRQAAVMTDQLTKDRTAAGLSATEAKATNAAHKAVVDAAGQLRRTLTLAEQQEQPDGEKLQERRDGLAQAMRAYRKEKRESEKETSEPDARTVTPHYYEAAAVPGASTGEDITTSEQASVPKVRLTADDYLARARRMQAETTDKTFRELATKISERFKKSDLSRRFGLAAVLGLFALPLNDGDGGYLDKAKNTAVLKDAILQSIAQNERHEAVRAPQSQSATENHEQNVETHKTPQLHDSEDAAEGLPKLFMSEGDGEVPYVVDAVPYTPEKAAAETAEAVSAAAESVNTAETAPEIYKIAARCTLWDVLEGQTKIPHGEWFEKAAAISPENLQQLIDLVRDELTEYPAKAKQAGLRTEDNPKLWLFEGDVLTSENLAYLNDLAKQIGTTHGLFEKDALGAALNEVSTSSPYIGSDSVPDIVPAKPLDYGEAQTNPPIFTAETPEGKELVAGQEDPEAFVFEMPKRPTNPSQTGAPTFSEEMYYQFLAGETPDISLETMSRPAFLEKQKLFDALVAKPENAVIAQAMGVRDNDFTKIQPGDDIDIELWHDFMLSPEMRIAELRSRAEAKINEST